MQRILFSDCLSTVLNTEDPPVPSGLRWDRGELALTTAAKQSIDILSRALDQTAEALSGIPTDKLSSGTPCTDWDVARLVAHVVAGPRNFVTMSSGGQPNWSAEPPLPHDWTAEFRSSADELLRMWREAGESASPQAVDWQTAEFAVHTWDLVRATGQ